MLHIAARAVGGLEPLGDPQIADFVWRRLRQAFPSVLAACLMPDHLHLLATFRPSYQQSLSRILASAACRMGRARVWHPIEAGVPVVGAEKGRRTVRYIHLNPCRAGLASDPLAWRWSTHRDVVGATHDPWVTPAHLADLFGASSISLPQRFHSYVSGDPSVQVAGTALPQAAPFRSIPEIPLGRVLLAAKVATRWSGVPTQHHAQVLLARHQGWRNASQVAEGIGISCRSVYRLARFPNPELLRHAATCLADPRLWI